MVDFLSKMAPQSVFFFKGVKSIKKRKKLSPFQNDGDDSTISKFKTCGSIWSTFLFTSGRECSKSIRTNEKTSERMMMKTQRRNKLELIKYT